MNAGGKKVATFLQVVLLLLLSWGPAHGGDPWKRLRQRLAPESRAAVEKPQKGGGADPWARLRAIYLPFSEERETAALVDPDAGKAVSGHFHRALRPFEDLIREASARFDIPVMIIAGLVMVESAGNPRAKAKTSSASGLTQTISSTFREARAGLSSIGIDIEDDPFDPRSSIMAGSWYLSRMYERAKADGKPGVGDRKRLDSWKHPLQYYYAGPSGGRKDGDVVIIYAGGKKVVVNKKAYSRKVMRWAEIMERFG